MLLIHRGSMSVLERAGGAPATTNNRMEMTAAIAAISALRRTGLDVIIRTDSRYLIDCCTKWMPGWKRNGWARKDGELKNVDLLQELDALLGRHTLRWEWVAGHSGEPGNERADGLANLAMDRLASGQEPTYENRTTWSHPMGTGT